MCKFRRWGFQDQKEFKRLTGRWDCFSRKRMAVKQRREFEEQLEELKKELDQEKNELEKERFKVKNYKLFNNCMLLDEAIEELQAG